MTPKEKATDLLDNHKMRCIECGGIETAKIHTSLTVNEIISVIENGNPIENQYNYWNEVKKELIKY